MTTEGNDFAYQDFSDEDISPLIEYVKAKTSFDLNRYKMPCVKRCIARRISSVSAKNLKSYAGLVMDSEKEREALLSLITIEFSSFFRNKEAFDTLRTSVLPEIIASKRDNSDNPLRIWSAGCATGEEAYSVSMILFELLAGIMDRFTMRIFATDVDRSSISKAIEGVYIEESLKQMDATTIRRYFIRDNASYRIKDFIRKPVFFGVQDIINDPPISHLDLLICRNLLIYLKKEAQLAVFEKLHYAIDEGGYLFLGKAETLPRKYESAFEIVDRIWKIYRKTK